ncbi:TadE/TadG family type IV pilus assembly protein [Phenylobacterium sp.]|uniref:TadE/TadG family type IV pilus assembly protein n=1 Tax=Phenylobacterium sp. TaxID=1871053 RepID=UPI002730A8AB|nr:TadE/TadG family type IV pilus assembly protein [Phenylobacterium sp.]MDP1617102.1 pilus assembly protein [Phenylobacterium sp.]
MRTSILKGLTARLKSGARDESGAAAMIFAVALVLLAPLTLGVFDLYIAANQKQKLQDALDAAALYAARSSAQTEKDINEIGQRALQANLSAFPGSALITATFVLDGPKVVGSAEMAPMAVSAGFFEHANVRANTEVLRAMDRLEVALVLDNTGSMAGTKLSTLKTAAKDLVDKLEAAGSRSTATDPIRISLVPFSSTVRIYENVSVKNYNTSTRTGPGIPNWVDSRAQGHGAAGVDIFTTVNTDRFAVLKSMKGSQVWGGCVESRRPPFDVQDTAPYPAKVDSYFVPYFAPDEPDDSGNWWSVKRYYNNYIPDKSTGSFKDLQGNVAKYKDATPSTSGPNRDCDLEPVARLTTDMTKLKSAIDDMKAVGNTNIPMGLVWGWHTLSPNAPFADGVAYGTKNHRKIIILMTDGDNVASTGNYENDSSYSGIGYIWQNLLGITSGTSTARTNAMNGRLKLLCENIKAKDIVLYTVRVEVKTGSSELLKTCATDSEKFFDVQNVAQLGAAFDAIAGSIDNLRLTK